MNELPAILVGMALANEFVLVRFPAPAPGHGAARRITLAVLIAVVLTAAMSWLVVTRLLDPFGLFDLALITVILTAAAVAPLAVWLATRLGAAGYNRAELTLVGINTGMLAVLLLVVEKLATLSSALLWSAGLAVVFSGISALLASLRRRFEAQQVPALLRGPAIALVTAGFLTLALTGLAGVLPQ